MKAKTRNNLFLRRLGYMKYRINYLNLEKIASALVGKCLKNNNF